MMRALIPIFVASFFISLNYGALLFINSSHLASFFSPEIVSMLFLLGAIGNIALFLLAPKLIERLGKRRLFLLFLIVAMAATFGLSYFTLDVAVAFSFVIYASLLYMIFYCLDLFLEEVSEDTKTGEIRGAYIALTHFGFIIGLTTLSILSTKDVLTQVYMVAGFLLLLPILFSLFSFKSSAPKWHGLHHRHHLLPLGAWWRAKSIRRATMARFTLEFLYAFMSIYIPIYLHSVLGFSWSVISGMFIIYLLPFILFQWPVGKLVDYFWGEKELMIVGFIFIIISLLLMPSLGVTALAWTIVLFFSMVGSSLVQITTDSYFFKHIDMYDTRLLSIFRLTRPASIVLGSIIGALSLSIFSFEKIFFVLAAVIFFGLKEALLIKDTR